MFLNRNSPGARVAWTAVPLMILMVGCAPALDWREVRAPGTSVQVLTPCKPATQQRQLPLAGVPAVVTLQACSAGGSTWAMVSADVVDPARVGSALQELSAASARNVGAKGAVASAFAPPGATPNAYSLRVRMTGQMPDGSAAQLESAVFSHGTWVFQATVLGEKADAEAADAFFASLRVMP